MSERTITIHAFCSVKGGVGKSTLAVACAKALASMGRAPVLLDCDLSGTSLADGLRLRAPRVGQHEDGSIDFDAMPQGEPLSVEDTRALRARRGDRAPGAPVIPPPYLNDLLDEEQEVFVDAFCWKHERDDGVRYLPSSSIHGDVIRSLKWIYAEFGDWAQRLLWMLDDFAHQLPALSDVIVDLPPGVWGFAHEALVGVSTLLRNEPMPGGFPAWHEGPIRWKARPFLVTSPDTNDLLPAIEYMGRHLRELPTLQPLVNRTSEGIDATRARVRDLLGATFRGMELETKLLRVPASRDLERIFRDGDLPSAAALQSLQAIFDGEEQP